MPLTLSLHNTVNLINVLKLGRYNYSKFIVSQL